MKEIIYQLWDNSILTYLLAFSASLVSFIFIRLMKTKFLGLMKKIDHSEEAKEFFPEEVLA